MKEFINHPQITRIFKPEIDAYQIKSIELDENNTFLLVQYMNAPQIPFELYKEIKQAAITAKYEDENAIDRYELSDTIKAAIESRNK
jgi:hypothetical protein